MPTPRNVHVRDQIIQGDHIYKLIGGEYSEARFPISYNNLAQDLSSEYNVANFSILNTIPNVYPPYNVINLAYDGIAYSFNIATGFYTAEKLALWMTTYIGTKIPGTTITWDMLEDRNYDGATKMRIASSAGPITMLPSPIWFIIGASPDEIEYTTSGVYPSVPQMNHISSLLIDGERISPGQAYNISGQGIDLMCTIPVDVDVGYVINYICNEDVMSKIMHRTASANQSFILSIKDPRGHVIYLDKNTAHSLFIRLRVRLV